MKRVAVSLITGFILTGAIFVLHVVVLQHFSWKDKPVMPNIFTYLLLPGYRLSFFFGVHRYAQLLLAGVLDSVLFGIPIWLLLTAKGVWSRL